MKKICAVVLLLCLLLCACSSAPETAESSSAAATPTPAPVSSAAAPTATPEPTVTPTPTAEPAAAYWNPLTGEPLDEPHTSRLYAVTINNVWVSLPHYGLNEADIFFEMLVNDYATRGLALFADPSDVGTIGSVRSMRYNFTDLCVSYDAIIAHAGGVQEVIDDMKSRGVNNLNADTTYFFRDEARLNAGYDYEHTLFVKGEDLPKYAEDKGYRTENEAGTQYGLTFAEDVVLDGETANSIDFRFWGNYRGMEYDAESDMYAYWHSDEVSLDGGTGEPELFKNVLLLHMEIVDTDGFHLAQHIGEGDGYYACGGKLVPIRWIHASHEEPFVFTYADGTPLNLEVGRSYIGFVPVENEISWE